MSLTNEQNLSKIAQSNDINLISCGFEQITVNAYVQYLTIPTNARYAFCVLESTATGTAARILQNRGTVVTSAVGIPVLAGGRFNIVNPSNLMGFQIIKDQAGVTVLSIEYFK